MIGTDMDTAEGYLGTAFFLGLDRLSLRSRVISDMLPLDAAQGRALFEEIGFPALPPLGCEDSLAYDPRPFYETLDAVARKGFTARERLQGRVSSLLITYVSSVQSHSQVAPTARLLGSADLSPEQTRDLTGSFASALRQLRGDERSFAAAVSRAGKNGLTGSLEQLVAKLDANGVSSRDLIGAAREYLVANFGGLRCSGMTPGQASALPEAVENFNRQFKNRLLEAQLSPIGIDEIRGARISPNRTGDSPWQSPESKRLAAAMKTLHFGNDRAANPLFFSELGTFLAQLESWNGDGERDVLFFHEKSIFYEALIDRIPDPNQKSTALESYVRFLEQNYLHPSRIEWFWHARRLLDGYKAANDRTEVLLTFANSRDSILSLYAEMELWELEVSRPREKARVN
jgi:hypothetical protein